MLFRSLIPLAGLDTGVSRRRQNSLRRLDEAWGEDWQDKLYPIMHRYPAKTFLRRLAVFTESNKLDWSEAFYRDQIETRKNRSRAPKDPWVINHDLVKEQGLPAVETGRIMEVGDEEQEEEEEEQSWSLSVSIKENGKTAKPIVAEREASGCAEGPDHGSR